MDPEIIAALIGPLITAGLAALAVGLQEWRTRRQSLDRQQGAIDQAIKEVAFIDAWITAQRKVADPPGLRARSDRALADLDRAYEVMAAVHAAAADAPPQRTGLERLRSLLLLNLSRTRAKVVRVFYLIFLVGGVLFTTVGMSEGLDTVNGGVYLSILTAMFFTLFCFTPAIGLFWSARLLDRAPHGHLTSGFPPPLDPGGSGYPATYPQFNPYAPQAPPTQAPYYPPSR
jgi:hypothetical protein